MESKYPVVFLELGDKLVFRRSGDKSGEDDVKFELVAILSPDSIRFKEWYQYEIIIERHPDNDQPH